MPVTPTTLNLQETIVLALASIVARALVLVNVLVNTMKSTIEKACRYIQRQAFKLVRYERWASL
jgi:hypothetical protein